MTSQPATIEEIVDPFSKLAKLREDVITGAHPRIKLPWAAIQQLKSADDRLKEDVSVSEPLPGFAASQGNHVPTPAVSAPTDLPVVSTQSNGLSVPSLPSSHATAPSVSQPSVPQFLPFLLEKSPALVQAEERSKRQREEQEGPRHAQELRNKRQRLEKALRAEFQKHIPEEKERNELKNWDAPCNVDVAQLHDAAIAAAKPDVPSPTAPRAAAPPSNHSSFDDNSYYSSQVNEHWTSGSEEGEVQSLDAGNAADAGEISHESPYIDGNRARPPGGSFDGHATAISAKPSHQSLSHTDVPAPIGSSHRRMRGGQEGRDESYSPPSPGAFRKDGPDTRPPDTIPRGPRAMQTASRPQHKRPNQPGRKGSETYSPPSPVFPVVQNHINAPLAPQPSRVSPLTSQYHSGQQQSRWEEQDGHRGPGPAYDYGQKNNKRSQQQQQNKGLVKQPNNQQRRQPHDKGGRPAQQMHYNDATPNNNSSSRKRARGDDLDEPQYNRQAPPPPKRQQLPPPPRTVPSPLPYIKPEPLSPPPPGAFALENAPRRDLSRRVVPVDEDRYAHDVISPRRAEYSRPQSARQPVYLGGPADVSPRAGDRYGGNRIPSSPVITRRPAGGEHNLRRVASLQNATQYSSHQEIPGYFSQEMQESYVARAPSRQQPIEDDVEYVPVIRHRAPARYASPGPISAEYSPNGYETRRTMPPPPKQKVIVLENGERWKVVPDTVEPRESLAPEPRRPEYRSQYAEDVNSPRPYYRSASHARHQQRREIVQIDDDENDYQRMPPPALPPPPPLMMRPRYVDDQPQQALSYSPHVRSRAASIQPLPGASDGRHGHMPLPRGYDYGPMQHMSERAYSARPNTMQHAAHFDRQPYYGMM